VKLLGGDGYRGSSFFDLLRTEQPHLLQSFSEQRQEHPPVELKVTRGTTILALKYVNGVVMAGDRMAVEGFQVSSKKIEKVFQADGHSAIAIAGAAGPCVEMVKLFQTELEHYEKIEGEELAMDGKANKLAQMVNMNLQAALYGLVVIPIFAGYDTRRGEGRIFRYDITGGRYEEEDFSATGSGGKDARNTLKKLYRKGLSEEEAIKISLEALLDASEEDLGTGGPDLLRGIFPITKTVTPQGVKDVPEAEVRKYCETILETKRV
jgi:proteasome beta subunit